MTTVLSREQILAARDTQIEWVEISEWGPAGSGVYVRGLTGVDRDGFEMDMIVGKGRKAEVNLRNLRAKLISRTAVDSDDPETAKPIFSHEDVEALGRKSGSALQKIYAVAQRLSGLSPEDVEELTDELGKDPNASSGSLSPSPLATIPSLTANAGSAAESSPSGSPTTESSPSAPDA